jgi:hypothetical protein
MISLATPPQVTISRAVPSSAQRKALISKLTYYPGAAPSSWWAFLTPSAYNVWHRQYTPLMAGSAPGAPNLPASPGDIAHVQRALTNSLLVWAAMRLPPPPEMLGWNDLAHSTYGTFASFHYISSAIQVLLNALTVLLNALTV